MHCEFKLVVYDDAKVVETVRRETSSVRQSDLIKELEEFRKSVNAALTKVIGNPADSSK